MKETEHNPFSLPNLDSSIGPSTSCVLGPTSLVTENFDVLSSSQFQPAYSNGQWHVSETVPLASSAYVPPSDLNNSSLMENNMEESLYDELDSILSPINVANSENWILPTPSLNQNLVNLTTEADIIFGLENDAILEKLNEQQNHLERSKIELTSIESEHTKLLERIKNAAKILRTVEERPEMLKGFLETHKHAILHCNGDMAKALTVVRSLLHTAPAEILLE